MAHFHHLRYFWMVAKKGGVRKAAETSRFPAIDQRAAQAFGRVFGEKLFKRSRPPSRVSEMGPPVLSYADEFSPRDVN